MNNLILFSQEEHNVDRNQNTTVPHSSIFQTFFKRYAFVIDIILSFTNDERPVGEPHI